MQQSEFEKEVQRKMEELKFSPADAVWEKVAAGLPAEKKPRRRVFFIVLLAVLLAGLLVVWNQFNAGDKVIAESNATQKQTIVQRNIPQNKEEKNKLPEVDDSKTKSSAAINVKENEESKIKNNSAIKLKENEGNNDKNIAQPVVQNKIQQQGTATVNGVTKNYLSASTYKNYKTKGRQKIKTTTPVAAFAAAEEGEWREKRVDRELTSTAKTVVTVSPPVAVTDDFGTGIKKMDSTVAINKKDTLHNIIAGNKEENKKRKNVKWRYGITAGAGAGILKKELFGSTPLFAADARLFNNTGANPQPNVLVSPMPNSPATGIAFNIGFYAQKNITARWKFITGLNYAFQFNAIKVGKRVDSSATFNFDANKSLSADNYYRIGDDIKYKNRFHLIEVPLLFQWQLSKKSPFYVEGGPSLRILINSNALVYNSNSNAYFTDGAVFNKLLLSFTAGAGINLAQNKKWPFSVGYQFGYSTGSVTKIPFGKQHLVNSMLNVKIPFKK